MRLRRRLVALGLAVAAPAAGVAVGSSLPAMAVAQQPAATPLPTSLGPTPTPIVSTTPGGLPVPPGSRIPAGPTKTRAWLARIQNATTVYAKPNFGARKIGRLPATTPWGGPAQLLVVDFRYVGLRRWAKVRLPGRPNANAAWVSDANIKLVETSWRIEVSLRMRELRVYRAGVIVRRVPVVIGAPSTPTPKGLFAIADQLRQPNPNVFAGAWVMPLTAHSNVLRHFDGGDGQVALHGRGGASLNDPVGTARSHGCIRLGNDSIRWIAARVPTGTPVLVF